MTAERKQNKMAHEIKLNIFPEDESYDKHTNIEKIEISKRVPKRERRSIALGHPISIFFIIRNVILKSEGIRR